MHSGYPSTDRPTVPRLEAQYGPHLAVDTYQLTVPRALIPTQEVLCGRLCPVRIKR